MKDLPKRKGDLPSKYSSTAGVSTAGVGQRSRHSCRFCSRLRRAAASYSALERPDRFFFSRNFLYAAVSFSFVSQPQLNGSVHGEKLRSFGPFRGSGRSFSYGLNIPFGEKHPIPEKEERQLYGGPPVHRGMFCCAVAA